MAQLLHPYTIGTKISKIRNYGQVKKYHHTDLGWNSRLDSIQVVVLREKLKLLMRNRCGRIVAGWYYDMLQHEDIITYQESEHNEVVHHLFVISIPK